MIIEYNLDIENEQKPFCFTLKSYSLFGTCLDFSNKLLSVQNITALELLLKVSESCSWDGFANALRAFQSKRNCLPAC